MSDGNVFLVRHAEPLRLRTSDGRLEERLSRAGEDSAAALARRLQARLSARHVIYSSPWPRSRATAVVVSNLTGAPVYVDDDLQEQRLRVDAGLAGAHIDGLRADPAAAAGEGVEALRARVLDALRGALQANPGQQIVFVTHQVVIAALANVLGRGEVLELPYCGVMAWQVRRPEHSSSDLSGTLLDVLTPPA